MRLVFPYVLLLAGCTQSSTPVEPSVKPAATRPPADPLLHFVDSFYFQHQKAPNNEVRKRTNEAFMEALKQRFTAGLLDSVPVVFKGIKRRTLGGYTAHFAYLQGSVYLDIIGRISDEDVNQLQEGQVYSIRGRFDKFLWTEVLPYYTEYAVYDAGIDVSNRKQVRCGVVYMDPLTFKSVP